MDIMQPSLKWQSAPAPWRLVRREIDVKGLAENLARDYPNATANQIVAMLATSGIAVSGGLIANWLAQGSGPQDLRWPRLVMLSTSPDNERVAMVSGSGPGGGIAAGHRALKQAGSDSAVRRNRPLAPVTTPLNRVFARLYCSFARYLQDARPWIGPGDARIWAAIEQIADDHERFGMRAAHLIQTRRGIVRRSQYPSGFTSFNDLSVRHVAGELVRQQHKLLVELEATLDELSADPEASSLVRSSIASQRQLSNALGAAMTPQRAEASNAVGTVRETPPMATVQRPAVPAPQREPEPHTAA